MQNSDLPVTAYLPKEDASLLPLASTPANLMRVINNMKGRPYGWGSINIEDPTDFLNDCSQELKSLYTPFGIWLPRHSSAQVDPTRIIGRVDDMTALNADERIKKLMADAGQHPFMTIVYVYNHVFIYLGNYENPMDTSHAVVPLTYQNLWGLRPVGLLNGRYVIGESALFPLLSHYPEKFPDGRDLISLAAKPAFIVAYLDQLPAETPSTAMQLWNNAGLQGYAAKPGMTEEKYLLQGPS